MLRKIITCLMVAGIFVLQINAEAKSIYDGEYSYTKKIGKNELGGGIEITSSNKAGTPAKYKAHFNGYYARGGMPNICDFEENLVQVTNNVFSMKSGKDNDFKFNLILVFEGNGLTIFSTDEIEGCGMGAESSVPAKYKKNK